MKNPGIMIIYPYNWEVELPEETESIGARIYKNIYDCGCAINLTCNSETEMAESKLQTNIDALRKFVQSQGWSIIDEKEIQSGYQLIITDGITRIPIALFHSGKALIQGKPGELQTKLKTWWDTRKASSTQP